MGLGLEICPFSHNTVLWVTRCAPREARAALRPRADAAHPTIVIAALRKRRARQQRSSSLRARERAVFWSPPRPHLGSFWRPSLPTSAANSFDDRFPPRARIFAGIM